MSESSNKQLLIVALDGATWDLLDDWISAGKLPNLAHLVKNGVSAHLESTIPPISPTAWPTFATGRNPGCHGVFDFLRPIRRRYTDLTPATVDYAQSPPLWEILSQRGRQVGVVNVPMTYPPRSVNGFLISGVPSPSGSELAYPPGLIDELRRQGWDLTRDATLVWGSFNEMLDYLQDLVHTRTEASCYLLTHKPWDFFMVHFLETDQVQHTFWRFLESNTALRDSVLHLFQEADQGIGQILDVAGDVPVLLMSDHGMGPTKYHVNLNNWLTQEGFMHWRQQPATGLRRLGYRVGLNPTRLYDLLPPQLVRKLTLGDVRTALAQLPAQHLSPWRSTVQKLTKRLSQALLLSFKDIDWSRTRAYSMGTTGAGLIYLNVRGREPEGIVAEGQDYERVRSRLIQRLMHFTDPWTDRPLVKRVYRREQLYHGPHLEEAPDLVVTYHYGEYDHKKGTVFLSHRAVEPVRNANATHRPYGIFTLYAPGIARTGERLDPVHIQDILPTALHLMGESVPRTLEGKVLEAALTDSHRAANPVQSSDGPPARVMTDRELSADELEDVLERLRSLGYV